ncbi:MAG: winged helix-turn-helix transcriptional regulator, partial [bacterium]|nr:winged helix-turn-helix transcriptional regulator [bacterium]
VEGWGRGMPLILTNEPGAQFREIARIFIADFARPSYHEDDEKISKETPKNPQRNPKEMILGFIKDNPTISAKELAEQCELSIYSVQHHINKLKEAGVLRHVGATKTGRWEVLCYKE